MMSEFENTSMGMEISRSLIWGNVAGFAPRDWRKQPEIVRPASMHASIWAYCIQNTLECQIWSDLCITTCNEVSFLWPIHVP
jgi:hypothetical protein